MFTSQSEFSVEENETYIGRVSVTDADGDSITFSLAGSDAERINLVKEGSDAILSFKTPPDYEKQSEYNFVVEASDGTNVAYQGIRVSIIDIDDENSPPVFLSPVSYQMNENQYDVGIISVSDADDDVVALSILDTGDGVKFTIDQTTGMLSFRALADFEEQIKYYIILVADDGYNYTNHNVSITLNNK